MRGRFIERTLPAKTSLCFLILLTLLAGTLVAPALRAQYASQPVESRYLFIFDTSSAMKKRLPAEQRGLNGFFAIGQLQRGDSIGVWTFNQDLHTGEFPLERWQPQDIAAIALNIMTFAKNQHYSKTTSFDHVMPKLSEIVRAAPRLTTVIFCDGEGPISGTPVDAKINSIFKANESAMRKARQPFIIVLRSQFGQYTGFSINTPDSITIPPFPPLPPPPPAPVVTAPAPPPPQPAPPPLIIIGTHVGTNVPPEMPPPAAPQPRIPAPAPPPATTPAPASPVPPAISPPPSNPVLETNPPPETNVAPPAAQSTPPSAAIVAPTLETAAPLVAPAAVATPPVASGIGKGRLLAIGAGCAVVAVGMYLILRPRHRHSSSLITESLNKNKS